MANYARMARLNSDPTTPRAISAAGVLAAFNTKKATTTSITPNERLPYTGPDVISGGDGPFLGKLASPGHPHHQCSWLACGEFQRIAGTTFPVSSVWTAPLGAMEHIPPAEIQNAQGAFVAPSTTSAAAAEADATLAASSDPTQNNLVT